MLSLCFTNEDEFKIGWHWSLDKHFTILGELLLVLDVIWGKSGILFISKFLKTNRKFKIKFDFSIWFYFEITDYESESNSKTKQKQPCASRKYLEFVCCFCCSLKYYVVNYDSLSVLFYLRNLTISLNISGNFITENKKPPEIGPTPMPKNDRRLRVRNSYFEKHCQFWLQVFRYFFWKWDLNTSSIMKLCVITPPKVGQSFLFISMIQC